MTTNWIAIANLIILVLACFMIWPVVKLYVSIYTSDMNVPFKIVLSAIIGVVMAAIMVYGVIQLHALGLFKCS